ncbi:MAG: SH3 domain-containing protein, partial [Anaerolineales bacterium]|nr:SH3 domain-containing protein [Anaerolineales bacterium]
APTPQPAPAPTPQPAPAPTPQPVPAPDSSPLIGSVVLSVGIRGLRVRSQPSLGGAFVAVIKAGRQMVILDPPAEARVKAGQAGQWLHVRTQDDKEGYVAAQYVTLGDAAASSDEPTPQPGSEPEPAPAPQPTPVPEPEPTPQPTPIPEPEPTPQPTPVPEPEPTPEPQPDDGPLIASVLLNVGASGLRLRVQPGLAGGYVGIVKAGRQMTVLDPHDEALAKVGRPGQWLHVRTTDGKVGYVAAEFVTFGDAVPASMSVTITGTIGTGGLRLREAPDPDSATRRIEPAGTVLDVLEPLEVAIARIGVQGQWLRVRDPQGFEGFVAAWYVEKK